MAQLIQSAVEAFPDGFYSPSLLIAAGGALALGVIVDMQKVSLDKQLSHSGPGLADPELAEQVGSELGSSIRRERLAHYSAVGLLMLGAVQLAQPYTTSSETHGSATIQLDVGYRADITDMKGGQSRIQASINGALKAAAERDVPIAFVISGGASTPIDRLPGRHKNLSGTRTKIVKALNDNRALRNGESIADGIQKAEAVSGSEASKIIVVTANPGDPRNAHVIKEESTRNKNIYAVVTGRGIGEYTVGNITLTSGIDAPGFEKLLGKDKVSTATSEQEVTTQIEKIIDANLLDRSTHTSHLPIEAASLFALTGAGLAIRRRTAGLAYKGEGE